VADIVWTDVTDFAAGLSAVSVNAQDAILAHVNLALDVECFGGEDAAKTKLARIYLAAHNGTSLALAASGAVGAAKKQTLGKASIEYSEISAASGPYGSTMWGQMFEGLANSSLCRAGLIV